jgi:hypothetical protein
LTPRYTISEAAVLKGAGSLNVELALDLARLGASPMAIRALGGEEAVRKAEASRHTLPLRRHRS